VTTPPKPNVAAAVVLAAGEGTRMRSSLPKVLHRLAGRSLLDHVLAAVTGVGVEHTLVVVGHGRDQVTASLGAASELQPVVQDKQNGTGHAVRLALEAYPPLLETPDATVLVVPGDAPLLTMQTLSALVDRHLATRAAATMLTAVVADPTGYGRVVRTSGGEVARIVEERDADDATKEIREINTSVYAFSAGLLTTMLGQLNTANAQGEEYLTDVIGLLVAAGEPVGAVIAVDPDETAGVNDRVQLAAAGAVLNRRLVDAAMRTGVTVVDPASTWLDAGVTFEPDAVLLPGCQLIGTTHIGAGAVIGPRSTLTDTAVEAGATVADSTAIGAKIGAGATVGPYTYLRPGTRLGARSKAGAYVELKAAEVGEGSKVPHLSYVGDAHIGRDSNIGAATVFVNYDGQDKHHTTVGDNVRIGSDTMLVAPVTVGDGAYTAAGSVITADVPAGALGIGRARQRNIDGWVARKRDSAGKEGHQ
jgi:bifunctional UDP-N-acetylglucosamine pyrophosphorylase/glucosamine-1-phosphate N-acetyltransferase